MGQRLFETQRQSMDNKLKDIFELVLNIGDVGPVVQKPINANPRLKINQ